VITISTIRKGSWQFHEVLFIGGLGDQPVPCSDRSYSPNRVDIHYVFKDGAWAIGTGTVSGPEVIDGEIVQGEDLEATFDGVYVYGCGVEYENCDHDDSEMPAWLSDPLMRRAATLPIPPEVPR
jgi:hypothetical protein